MQKKDTVTITEIARESGVSIATVSRVLNGTVPVSPDKRERVEKTIQKYQFTPNALARGLIKKQTMTLGVILPDISNPYFSSMFLEIERCALEAGYSILLCNTLFGGSSHGIPYTKDESSYFKMLQDKQVDGVLIIGGQIDLLHVGADYKTALRQLSRQLPVVVVGNKISDMDCIFLEPENGSGTAQAVKYLFQLGHRRIAFVGGQTGVTITKIRFDAYRKALEECSLPFDEALVVLSDYYLEDGYHAMRLLLNRNTDFTAFLAVNDYVALGAQRAMADYGLAIPDKAALVSCDQFFTGEYQIPRLTSVHQHHELLARSIMKTLLALIRGEELPVASIPHPELIVRESCGAMMKGASHDLA